MSQPKPESFLDELKRRKVVRVGIVYAAVAWGVLQLADVALSTFGAPLWVMQAVMILLALGFPLAIALAWAFEVTPVGVRRTAEASDTRGTRSAPQSAEGPETAPAVAPAAASSWLSARSMAVILLFALMGFGSWYVGRATAGTATPDGAAIAVLPFSDLSGDGSNRAFTDGLHDDLLTHLSKVASLRITSRTSVQEYRDSEKPIQAIARELGVGAVLEGGVQRSGERLRINVQLIDGATDEHIWAETYDSDLTVSDIFDIQTRIATAITDALRAELTSEERAAIAELPTDDIAAYEAYLAGLAAGHWFPTDSAALLFEKAAALDPGFAEAWAAAARAWSWRFRMLVEDVTQGARRTEYRTAAQHALSQARDLAPRDRETRLAEGYLQYYVDWDFAAAARTFEGLLTGDAEDPEMPRAVALIYRRQGRWDRALDRFRNAARLDPRNSDFALDLGYTLYYVRQLGEAEQVVRLALARDPEYFRLNDLMADILVARGASPDDVEPYVERSDMQIATRIAQRLVIGGDGLAAYYRELSVVPRDRWAAPSDVHWSLALLAHAAGLPAAAMHADSAIAGTRILDRIDIAPGAPFAERRAPARGFAIRGLALAIRGLHQEARADLRRSRALWGPDEDHAGDGSDQAIVRAYAWAILGDADAFFTELAPHAQGPSSLQARHLTDAAILTRFAGDPRSAELIRAMRSPAPRKSGS